MRVTITEKGLEFRRQLLLEQEREGSELPYESNRHSGFVLAEPSQGYWGHSSNKKSKAQSRRQSWIPDSEALLQAVRVLHPPTRIHIKRPEVKISPHLLPKYRSGSAHTSMTFPTSSYFTTPRPSLLSSRQDQRSAQEFLLQTQRIFANKLSPSELIKRGLRADKTREKQEEVKRARKVRDERARRKLMKNETKESELLAEHARLAMQIEGLMNRVLTPKTDRERMQMRITSKHRAVALAWGRTKRCLKLAAPIRGLISPRYSELRQKLPPPPNRCDPIKQYPPID